MLIKAKFYDWEADFAFRPPLREVLINPEQIVDVRESYCQRCGPVRKVKLTDGRTLNCEPGVWESLSRGEGAA